MQVTVRVVDELEVVDVDHEQRRRRIGRAAAEQGIVRRIEEGAPHEHTREIVHLARDFARRRARRLLGRCRRIGKTAARRAETSHDRLEQREELRIELMSDVAPHHVERLIVRHGLLVATLGCERVVDIGDTQDARGARDLLALEPVWIAGTVPTLVVRFHDRAHVPGEIDVGEHLHTPDGVLLDHHPFFRR